MPEPASTTQSLAREAAVDRYLVLKPAVVARMNDFVDTELRSEFESLTVHQVKALVRLPPDGLTMHELAADLGITGATACALADRLVAQGLAERRADSLDRRVVRLSPSPCGASISERQRQAQRQRAVAMFGLLSDSQVVAYIGIMETLATAPAELAGVSA
ncbi:MAG: MarR family winged helix-turn-helix transcriptional regulator [Acidimicrobiales bacterium]